MRQGKVNKNKRKIVFQGVSLCCLKNMSTSSKSEKPRIIYFKKVHILFDRMYRIYSTNKIYTVGAYLVIDARISTASANLSNHLANSDSVSQFF